MLVQHDLHRNGAVRKGMAGHARYNRDMSRSADAISPCLAGVCSQAALHGLQSDIAPMA